MGVSLYYNRSAALRVRAWGGRLRVYLVLDDGVPHLLETAHGIEGLGIAHNRAERLLHFRWGQQAQIGCRGEPNQKKIEYESVAITTIVLMVVRAQALGFGRTEL